jgi:hypothetical protein
MMGVGMIMGIAFVVVTVFLAGLEWLSRTRAVPAPQPVKIDQAPRRAR